MSRLISCVPLTQHDQPTPTDERMLNLGIIWERNRELGLAHIALRRYVRATPFQKRAQVCMVQWERLTMQVCVIECVVLCRAGGRARGCLNQGLRWAVLVCFATARTSLSRLFASARSVTRRRIVDCRAPIALGLR